MRTSTEISAMSARNPTALKRLDWFMSPANKDLKLKWAATEFVLMRNYPELKAPLIDQSKHEHFEVTVRVEDGNNAPHVPGNRISEYVKV